MTVETTAALILVFSFLFMVLVRFPIAVAMGLASLVTTVYLDLPIMMVAQNMIKGLSSFTLLAVPFFILAGEIMGAGGISTRLIRLSNALVGWLRGGLAMVNIVASLFFGGISGSSAADTASIGPILIPIMKKQGYDVEFATNITMASSVEGILIPPSHNMVIYALAAGSVSIADLFMAGFVPGVLLGAALMIYSFIVSVQRKYPKGDALRLGNIWNAAKDAIWGLSTVLIVVGGVVTGVVTATESAAAAVVWAFIVAMFVYKELTPRGVVTILGKTMKTLSIVMIIIGTSSAFGWLLAYLQVPDMIVSSVTGITTNSVAIILIINVILLVLGMLMDMAAIILIATPVLLPLAMRAGMDPVHFGVVMMLNLGIGLLTPPVGSTLFIGSAISGVRIERLARTMLPIYAVMFIVLMLITFVPEIVLTLPRMML